MRIFESLGEIASTPQPTQGFFMMNDQNWSDRPRIVGSHKIIIYKDSEGQSPSSSLQGDPGGDQGGEGRGLARKEDSVSLKAAIDWSPMIRGGTTLTTLPAATLISCLRENP